MAKKTLSKRLVALLLSVAVIFSSFATLSFSAFAADPVAELVYDGSVAGMTDDLPFSIENKTITYKDGETNLLVGKEYEVYSFNATGGVQSISDANITSVAKCTDGAINDGVDIWPGGTKRTVDVVYYLGNTVTPEYFAFIQRAAVSLQTYNYEVYGSATYTALRTEPTLLGTYARTDEATEDRQVNIFRFPENAQGIKFIMVRMTQENYTCNAGGYRPEEFILLGDEADDADNFLREGESAAVPSENALTSTQIQIYRGGAYIANETDPGVMQDGAVGAQRFINASKGFSTDADGDGTHDTWLTEGEFTIDIVYNLGEKKDISNIFVAGYTQEKKFRIGKYKLYASENRDDVFDHEIAEYANTGAVRNQYFTFSGEKAIYGQYVALRILKPVAYDSQIHDYNLWIEEFRVYGGDVNCENHHYPEYVAQQDPTDWDAGVKAHYACKLCGATFLDADCTVVATPEALYIAPLGSIYAARLIYDGSAAGMGADLPFTIANNVITYNDGETNLLAGKEYEVYSYSATGLIQSISAANVESVSKCTDGKISQGTDIWAGGTRKTVDVVYHLGNTVTPEYFAFVQRPALSLQTYKYQVYGATTYTGLRTNPILIGENIRTDDDTVDHQVNVFKFPENTQGFKYIMIRLTQENYTCNAGGYRPEEFILLGDEAADADASLHESEGATVPTENALTAEAVNIYKKDAEFLYSLNVASLQDGEVGAQTFVSLDKNFSTDTNGDGTHDTWLTEGEYYVDIVYDLGRAKKISNVLVASYTNEQKFRLGKYKLYASNDRETLFDNEIATYSNTGAVRRQYFTFDAEETVGRYVALRVLKPIAYDSQINDYGLWVEEFRVYGTDAVVMHQVEFLDRMGKVIHTAEVEDGTTIPEADVLAANAAVPAIYGYEKYIDGATGMQGWTGDITEPVTAAASFTALYVRATETYTVSVQKIGEEATLLDPMKFDERIELIDDNAAVWTVNGEIVAEGTNAVAYVYGDMTIVAEAAAPAETTSVSIIGIDKDAEGGSLNVFAHIYNTDESVTVESYGIIFVSGTTYDKIQNQDDWSEATLNADSSLRHARTVITTNSTNYMSSLTGISTTSYVRRVARAYAVLSDGTTIYSDAIVSEFGSK